MLPVVGPAAELVAELDGPVVVLEQLEGCGGMRVQEKQDDPVKMLRQDLRSPGNFINRKK